MPKTPKDPTASSNEMEDRDPTQEELKRIGEITIPPLTAPMDPSRDDDYEDPPRPFAAQPISPTLESMEKRIQELQDAISSNKSGNEGMIASALLILAESMSGLKQAQLQGATTIADMQRRTVAPENRFAPGISAFNPRGDKDFPRPLLKCEMYLPWPAENGEALTREEIQYLNLLIPGSYTVRRVDRTPVKLLVKIETHLDSELPSRLLISHDTAFNNDNHRLMPYDWLRQMVMGHADLKEQGKAIVTMEEEEMFIAARRFNSGELAAAGQLVVSIGS